MENPIRVLVVDDHPVVRQGVCALLGGVADIAVVGEAGDGLQAVEAARQLSPRVILMDLKLPQIDGAEATRRILAAQPEVGIAIMTGTDVDAEVLTAIEAGALGYLAKTSKREEFLDAIRRLSLGEAWLPPRLTRKLLTHLKSPATARPDPLTGRESEVLTLLARGWGNRSIARELSIAEVTVRTHVSHILDKLEASNRVEAVLLALRSGLVQESP